MLAFATFLRMIVSSPAQTSLIVLLPIVVAVGQLANSVMTDLSFLVSVPFAITVVGFGVVVFQYDYARFRRQELELLVAESH